MCSRCLGNKNTAAVEQVKEFLQKLKPKCNTSPDGIPYTAARIIKRNGNDVIQMNDVHVCKIQENEIILKPNFETFSFEHSKTVLSRLIIFSDVSRSFCYEYTLYKLMTVFTCGSCRTKNHTSIVELCQKEDGTEFVALKSSHHACEPRKYDPEKYEK